MVLPKTIYFDMDGTIADLYGVTNWLERIRHEDATIYRDAAPMLNMEKLGWALSLLQEAGVKIGVISWGSKTASNLFDVETIIEKKKWLGRYFPFFTFDEIHVIHYGIPKHKVASEVGYLFDDNESVRADWERNGGIALPQTNIIDALVEIANTL